MRKIDLVGHFTWILKRSDRPFAWVPSTFAIIGVISPASLSSASLLASFSHVSSSRLQCPHHGAYTETMSLNLGFFFTRSEKREKIDLKNQAETLVYQAEKQMGELGDKVDADAKAKLEEKRLKLKEATEKDDYDAMKTLLEELQQELYTVGASVYQQEGAAAGAGAPGADAGAGANAGGGDASDDVIDAEFTETK